MAAPKQIFRVGYAGLLDLLSLKALPHYRSSYILERGAPYSERIDHEEIHYYPKKYFTKDRNNAIAHVEFALKYDGFNLEILHAVFEKMDSQLLENYVREHPTGHMARRIWFLYEFLTGKVLEIPDTTGGSYTLLLDPAQFFTATPRRSRRHYVDNNLLGTPLFCPIVRRTEKLEEFEEKNLPEMANRLLQQYDPKITSRAVNYLYLKETMSSYEIEREKPDSSRAERFVQALRRADLLGTISKEALIELQNLIVDPRFTDSDYRHFQNYIGSEARLDVHYPQLVYIPPKPADVPSLMQGLLETLDRMYKSKTHPVVVAAVIAFGFVFIHPFGDGNGRIHRFLIHYIFSHTGFVPKGAIFPVSAVMIKEMSLYDTLLESFSQPLMKLITNCLLDDSGQLEVKNDTAKHYRYLDFTQFAEYLFGCVEQTIKTDFKNELNYIKNYDKVKKIIQNIADMPDNKINLFIQLVLQNRGHLSHKKRETHFKLLKDEEIQQMEQAVREHMEFD